MARALRQLGIERIGIIRRVQADGRVAQLDLVRQIHVSTAETEQTEQRGLPPRQPVADDFNQLRLAATIMPVKALRGDKVGPRSELFGIDRQDGMPYIAGLSKVLFRHLLDQVVVEPNKDIFGLL